MAARRTTSGPLRESAPLEFSGGRARVDRDKKIVFGVKIVGRISPNTHRTAGVTRGTAYTPEALRKAIPLYEGVKVNVDHPPLDKRDAGKFDRPADDRLGKICNVRLEGGELYGDLHLVPSHRLTESLLDAASDPMLWDCYALSHNARGDGPVKDGVWVIEQIGSVKSVDVVADGGTNRSLFEGREVAKVALRSLCESKPALGKKLGKLLAICPKAGELLVESEEGGEGGDYRDHLHAAKKMCEDMGDGDMASKIHGLMKPKKEGEADESDEDDEKAAAGEEKKADADEKKDAKPAAMESRLKELEAKEACRQLCESLNFAPSGLQLKALVPLAAADRTALIKEFKGSRPGPQSRSLIPAPKPADGAALTESAEGVPQKGDDQLAWLRS